MLGMPDEGVERVPPERVREGVACLLSLPVQDPAVTRFLHTAEQEGTDLSLLWGTPAKNTGGGFTDVCLAVPGTGRTAMIFVSAGDLEAVVPAVAQRRGRVVRSALRFLQQGSDPSGTIAPSAQNLVLAQALLLPEQAAGIAALEAGGLQRLAELAYLKRDIPRRAAGGVPVWPAGVSVTPLSRFSTADGDAALEQGLTASYIGTLDCPALCGLRSVQDVLESHRGVGEYDPRLWFVVSDQGTPAGCMLLSRVPTAETAELVYLGLGPTLRGRGLGRGLLELALAVLSGRGERSLACAVDTGNTPALGLYRALRFRTFATRVALVRGL